MYRVWETNPKAEYFIIRQERLRVFFGTLLFSEKTKNEQMQYTFEALLTVIHLLVPQIILYIKLKRCTNVDNIKNAFHLKF